MRSLVEFSIGGFGSVIAEVLTLPMDTVKVRLQIDNKATLTKTMQQMLLKEGIGSFFNGIEPAVIRQALYGSLRYGLYPIFKYYICYDDNRPQLLNRLLAGCLSGGISSAICNPTDLIKIRMQSTQNFLLKSDKFEENDKYKKNVGKFHYRNFYHALTEIVRHEGYLSLYTGVGPTVCRASVLAAVEMSVYDIVKPYLARILQLSLQSFLLHAMTALIASFFSSLFSNPFDIARSRLMAQPKDNKGKGKLYNGVLDCLTKSVQQEGIQVLLSGFWAFFLRLGPNTMITFIAMEKLRQLLLN